MSQMLPYWKERGQSPEWATEMRGDEPILQIMKKVIEQVLPDGGKVMEFAAGTGRVLKALAYHFNKHEFFGVDFCKEVVDQKIFENVEVRDLMNSPCPEADVIYTHAALMHIPPDEVETVLKKLLGSCNYLMLGETVTEKNHNQAYYVFTHDYKALLDKYDAKMQILHSIPQSHHQETLYILAKSTAFTKNKVGRRKTKTESKPIAKKKRSAGRPKKKKG